MIKQQVINLLEAPVHAIAHQANCFHIMGGGVAAQISKKYPEAYAADLKTKKGDKTKLGTYSFCVTNDGKIIINVYSQYALANGLEHATDYNMIERAFRNIEEAFSDSDIVLGVPYEYGCGLGGGEWHVVEAIFRQIFEKSRTTLLICQWPPRNSLDDLKQAIDTARGGPAPSQMIGFA